MQNNVHYLRQWLGKKKKKKRLKAEQNNHLQVYPGHLSLKNGYDLFLANRVNRGVNFLLDSIVCPVLTPTGTRFWLLPIIKIIL